MKLSIRYKLIFSISLLILALFSFTAYLFITEKKAELTDDIVANALAFSRFTGSSVVESYDLYLSQDSFVYFHREIQSLFAKNDDISALSLFSYAGERIYDSAQDIEKRYSGEPRMVEDVLLIARVQSEFVSLMAEDGRIRYLDEREGEVVYTDAFGTPVAPFGAGTLVLSIVVPVTEEFSVEYVIDYHNLYLRIDAMVTRIVYLTLFGVFLGILLSLLLSSHVTRPVRQLVGAANQVAQGNLSTQVQIHTRDELQFLGETFNAMTRDLKDSVAARVYKERVGRELELATDIQQQIIPHDLPKVEGLDLAAGLIPAEEIGGDMYDFLLNDERLLMYLGDVTGHGVPSGIVSSIASALFYGFSGERDLKEIMIRVNQVLKVKTMPSMFMTLCLMEWDLVRRQFSYVSAGHEQILHCRAATQEVILTPSGGVALGMVANITPHLTLQNLDLAVGDFLVIYSDGIPEARSAEAQYGRERLQKAVAQFSTLHSALAIKEAILADVEAFVGISPQLDDVTLVVVRRTA